MFFLQYNMHYQFSFTNFCQIIKWLFFVFLYRGRHRWIRIHKSLAKEKSWQNHRCQRCWGSHGVALGNTGSHNEWSIHWITELGWQKCYSRGRLIKIRIILFWFKSCYLFCHRWNPWDFYPLHDERSVTDRKTVGSDDAFLHIS